jgi:hypothetical protein
MDALRLFLEGLLALSTISFFVCACLADDTDSGTPPGRRQGATASVYTMQFSEAMQVSAVLSA